VGACVRFVASLKRDDAYERYWPVLEGICTVRRWRKSHMAIADCRVGRFRLRLPLQPRAELTLVQLPWQHTEVLGANAEVLV